MIVATPVPSAFATPKLRYAEGRRGFARLFVWLRRDDVRFGWTKFAHRCTNEITKKIMYYVYSLKCNNGYYVGCTDNLRDRIKRHQKGNVLATVKRLPVKIDFYLAINDKYKAFEFENI